MIRMMTENSIVLDHCGHRNLSMEMDDNIGLNGMTQKDPVRVRDVVTYVIYH